jgi:hypothetical protein
VSAQPLGAGEVSLIKEKLWSDEVIYGGEEKLDTDI